MEGVRVHYISQYISISMIRCPLAFHTPEVIYSFLKEQVGPLNMLIKKGQAIINFTRADLAATALEKYQNCMLRGLPLEMYPYKDGDIDRLPLVARQGQMVAQQTLEANEVSVPQPKYSEFTMAVEEGLKIKDPQNFLEVTAKKNRKQIIEFINTYTPLLEAAQQKAKNIQDEMMAEEGRSNKLESFYRFYEKQSQNLVKEIKDEFKKFKSKVSKYGNKEKAFEIEPQIKLKSQHEPMPESKGFKLHCSYLNTNNYTGFKRTVALNEEHFVVSAQNNHAGKLLFYKAGEEYLQSERDIRGGAYGLCTLDEHILVGDWQGRLCFFRSPDFTDMEASPKLHSSVIFNIAKVATNPLGYLLATNSVDGVLKLVQATLESFTPEDSTLFYKEIYEHPQRSVTTVTHFKDNLMAFTNENKLTIFDCEALKEVSTHHTSKSPQMLRISPVDQTTIAAASEKHLSLIDVYNNAKTLNVKIGKDIRTVTALSEHRILYACESGEMGVFDRRKGRSIWHDSHQHKSRIYDVAQMDKRLISIDQNGQILTWNPQ